MQITLHYLIFLNPSILTMYKLLLKQVSLLTVAQRQQAGF